MAAPDFTAARRAMVERQIAARGIDDPAILAAFLEVPRERFVEPDEAERAYGDHPLPIGCGQTISQPYVVAAMIAAAGVRAGSRVLEVGAGSGYAAALLSRIAAEVIAVERHPMLAEAARRRCAALGYRNLSIIAGDGWAGWPDRAPYDAILVAAAAAEVPPPLIDQIGPGGRLVMPVGGEGVQQLTRISRTRDGTVREELSAVRFVPLLPGTADQRETA